MTIPLGTTPGTWYILARPTPTMPSPSRTKPITLALARSRSRPCLIPRLHRCRPASRRARPVAARSSRLGHVHRQSRRLRHQGLQRLQEQRSSQAGDAPPPPPRPGWLPRRRSPTPSPLSITPTTSRSGAPRRRDDTGLHHLAVWAGGFAGRPRTIRRDDPSGQHDIDGHRRRWTSAAALTAHLYCLLGYCLPGTPSDIFLAKFTPGRRPSLVQEHRRLSDDSGRSPSTAMATCW